MVRAARQKPTSREKAETGSRRDILRAAVELFGVYGFPSTSVQEIVERAGVSKGAFYYWFESKDDVLRLIHDEFIEEQLERAEGVLARNLSAAESLTLLVGEIFQSIELHHDEISVYLREYRFLSEASFALLKTKRDRIEDIFVAVLERGVAEGEFRDTGPVTLVAFGILGMCSWATEWYRHNSEVPARDIAAIYADIALNGLVPRQT